MGWVGWKFVFTSIGSASSFSWNLPWEDFKDWLFGESELYVLLTLIRKSKIHGLSHSNDIRGEIAWFSSCVKFWMLPIYCSFLFLAGRRTDRLVIFPCFCGRFGRSENLLGTRLFENVLSFQEFCLLLLNSGLYNWRCFAA